MGAACRIVALWFRTRASAPLSPGTWIFVLSGGLPWFRPVFVCQVDSRVTMLEREGRHLSQKLKLSE